MASLNRTLAVQMILAACVLMVLWIIIGPQTIIDGLVKFASYLRGAPVVQTACFMIVLQVLWIVLCVPYNSTIQVINGFVFGFKIGSAINIGGLLLGCASAFAIARFFVGNTHRDRFTADVTEILSLTAGKGFVYLVFFRLISVPFWIKVYAPPILLDISFEIYIKSVFLGTCPFGVFYALIGQQTSVLSSSFTEQDTPYYLKMAAAAFIIISRVATVMIGIWAYSHLRARLDQKDLQDALLA